MSEERFVDTPPAGAEGWREVWRENRRYRVRGFIATLAQKILRRFNVTEAERQRDFNLAMLDLLADLRGELEGIRRDSRADVEALQQDIRMGDEGLARDLAAVRALIPVASMRNDSLIAALDQKIESVAVRVRDAVNPSPASGTTTSASSDRIYRRLEDGLRGSESRILEEVQPYVDLARAHQPVLDVGCGRGEFLAVAIAAGIDARGFDLNERSVADLRARALAAEVAGVPECFDSFADGSIGAVLAMHVVEHLPVDALFAFFTGAARVLRPGGLLMIETPNAESMLVSASEFWRDPTHLAPRHPAALTLLGREHGFAVEEIRAVHPFPEATRIPIADSDPVALQRVVQQLNERLFGPQDLRLILRRE